MEMAGELPSAGAFYTYVTRGLGPRAGFVTGGLMFVAYALLPPAEIGLIGCYLQSTFQTEWSVEHPVVDHRPGPRGVHDLPGLRGHHVEHPDRAWCSSPPRCIVVLLIAVIIVIKGGAHGLTLKPLSPSASPHGFKGLVTGFVFAALSFVGFEGASTLERRGPRAEARPCRRPLCCPAPWWV